MLKKNNMYTRRRRYPIRKNFVRRNRRYFGKRTFRKRKIMSRTQKMICRAPQHIVADRYFVKLNAVGTTVTSAPQDDPQYFYIKGNGLENPLGNTPFTNAQPLGYDKIGNLYQKFIVHGCKVKIEITNNTSSQSMGVVLFPTTEVNPLGTPPYTYAQALALPYAKDRFVGAISGNNKITLTNYISTNKIYGVPKSKIRDEDNFAGTTISEEISPNSDPINAWFWNLTISNNTGVATSMSYNMVCKVTWYCEFFNRTPLAQQVV